MVISLVTLCGLPGCGKTTFCKQFCSYASSSARQFDVPRFSVVHIEFDLIEQQLKGKSHEFDPGVWKSARKMLVQNVINTVEYFVFYFLFAHLILLKFIWIKYVDKYFKICLFMYCLWFRG